jgi:hypothetical protein
MPRAVCSNIEQTLKTRGSPCQVQTQTTARLELVHASSQRILFERILAGRRPELLLPFQNPRASSGGFSLRDVTGSLQGDRKRSVGQWVVRRENGKGHGGCDGLIMLAGIPQSANETVMSFNVRSVCGDGRSKGLGRFRRPVDSEKIESLLGKRIGSGKVGHGWL